MNLFQAISRRPRERSFSNPPLGLDTWANQLTWAPTQTLVQNDREEIGSDYRSYVEGIYKNNGVVYACMAARALLFSEARFQWRQLRSGRPGDYFGTQDLAVLEKPWPNGTTGDLLAQAIQDIDLAGNFYAVREGDELRRLRPDWVSIIKGSRRRGWEPGDLDTDAARLPVSPGRHLRGPGRCSAAPRDRCPLHGAAEGPVRRLSRHVVADAADLREVLGDTAAMEHKLRFFQGGATPNMVVSMPPEVKKDAFTHWTEAFRAKYEHGPTTLTRPSSLVVGPT
jgi:hypothetical protein